MLTYLDVEVEVEGGTHLERIGYRNLTGMGPWSPLMSKLPNQPPLALLRPSCYRRSTGAVAVVVIYVKL